MKALIKTNSEIGNEKFDMENTGERHDLNSDIKDEADYYVHLMHLATYNYAIKFVPDKQVLDYGCGTGYGSHILAGEAKNVVAVDISEAAIAYAKDSYSSQNLQFKKLNEIDFKVEKFDVITSFQVIEHISEVKEYLSKLNGMLNPGGILILSTPDKSNRLFWGIQKPWNIFHVKEYSGSSLSRLLKRHFNEVSILKITSQPEFVLTEIRRRKKQRIITLPCTLFFYPDFLRIKLLRFEAKLFERIKGKNNNSGSNLSSNTEKSENIPKQFSVADMEISENPKYPTDLIAICRMESQ